MNYADKAVKNVPTEFLLLEILGREGTVDISYSQSSYAGEWLETTVGIGNDHTAQIRLPREDLEALYARSQAVETPS